MNKYKHIIFHFIIALIVGCLSFYFRESFKEASTSVMLGLVTFFAITALRIHFISEKTLELYEKLEVFQGTLKSQDTFSEIALVYTFKKLQKLTKNIISVDKSNVLEFWSTCVSKAKDSWTAVSFVRPEESWDLGWEKRATALQVERLASGCKIERIFVLQKRTDLSNYEHILAEQANNGIKVYWVLLDKLLKKSLLKDAIDSLKTWDFALMDKKLVYRTQLKRRKIESADLSKDYSLVKSADFIIQEIRHHAVIWES